MLGILADSIFGTHVDSIADILFWIVLAQVLLFAAVEVCIVILLRRPKDADQSSEQRSPEQSPAPSGDVAASVAAEQVAAEQETAEQVVSEQISAEQVAPQQQEAAQPAPIIVDTADSHEAGILRYDKSFVARLIQSDDWLKDRYNVLKNELLSYKGVKCRYNWKRETFKAGKKYVARLLFRGKTLCVLYPLDPETYPADSAYRAEAVNAPTLMDTPSMYRIRNEKHFKVALALLNVTARELGLTRTARIPEDYYMPYEGTLQLIERGLVKRKIKSASEEAIFTRKNSDD